MTKISIYSIDEKVLGNDKWIGSDAQNQYATKNFTPSKLAEYFNENQVIDIGTPIRYKYDILEIGDSRLPGTITFNPQVGTPYSFSDISTFLLSKYTLKGNDVTEYLNFLIGTNVLISKSSDVNKFGYFSVTNIEEYLPEPNFFEVTLEYITGNGSIEEDRDYLISLIDVSTGGGVTPTLQQVTDTGNTTTNNIEFETGVGIILDNNSKLKEGTIDAGYGGSKGIAQICAVGYELKWEAGRLYIMNDGGLTIREVSHNFTYTPTIYDDIDKGFIVGSRWILDNGDLYVCSDNTNDNAVWELQVIGNQDLQSVTDVGNITTNAIYSSLGLYVSDGVFDYGIQDDSTIVSRSTIVIRKPEINHAAYIGVSLITDNRNYELPDASGTIALTSDIPTIGTWGSLNYPIWSSGTPFVKMTADGTFALDTNTYLTTAVTSVGLSMPSAFTVSNSPITGAGVIAVSGAGTSSQYIRGDGQLAAMPSGGGGGSSVNYYLNGSVASSVAGYQQLSNIAIIGGGTDFTLTGNGLIKQFLTDVGNPNRIEIPGGAWNFEMWFSMSSNGGTPKFYVELLKYNGTTFTTIANSSAVPETINGGTNIDLYFTSLAVPTTTLLTTDRLAIRVYIVNNSGGRTATLHTEDNHLCQIITTFSGGVTSLNGLTANTQYLAVGTTGTDFNISSITDTHTFNLPSASATARGLVTTNGQTLAGAKTFSSAPILSSLTASQLLALDASKNIQSLDTATYPSLTELSYVKGTTSPIQTQLNNKKDFTTIFYSQTPILPASVNWFRPVRGQNNWFTHTYDQEVLSTFNPDLGLLSFDNRANKYTIVKQSKVNSAIISVCLNTSLETFRIVCLSFKISSGVVTNQTVLFDSVVNGNSLNNVTVIPTINNTYVLDAGSFITYFLFNNNTAITIRTLNVNLNLETI